MEAGRLKQRISIQYKAVTRSSFGEETITWTTQDTIWAAVEPLRGREFFESQKINSEINYRVIIRYRENIKPEMRILYGARIFDILAIIDPLEKHEELQLMCKEVV